MEHMRALAACILSMSSPTKQPHMCLRGVRRAPNGKPTDSSQACAPSPENKNGGIFHRRRGFWVETYGHLFRRSD
ncbi:hypothetical protein BC835DRAFT_884918 [Cytidiella melzeri]|nr:hypothetical protein BC835DRAFT_884918 [Cytidiella melzeri]